MVVREMFYKLAKEHNLRLEFRLDYDLFEFAKEGLIDQSKVF